MMRPNHNKIEGNVVKLTDNMWFIERHFLVRVPGPDGKWSWMAFKKFQNRVPQDFKFESNKPEDMFWALKFFNEDLSSPVVVEAIPEGFTGRRKR